MSTYDHARSYISKVPSAGQGNRNDELNKLAFAVAERFALSDGEYTTLLKEWVARCNPPLSDGETQQTIRSALAGARNKGAIGSKARTYSNNGNGSYRPPAAPTQAPTEPPKPPKPQYEPDKPTELPRPLTDPTRRFLMVAFNAGEFIGIAEATITEDRCIPKGAGATYSREEWIKKLDAVDGDPNKIFKGTGGAFVRINPLKPDGCKDADVTAFRHALIEFDQCSIEEQWNLITQSNIPCSAVLHSGNKSLHAWVRVDAKNITEYTARVKHLYDHFAEYGIDPKNKNPSRFSRLPGVQRGKKKQELLALQVGAESWDQWLIDREVQGIGKVVKLSELLDFKPDADPNSVIGNRWLCRGGSCLIVGPSGVGKSALEMQMAITWALGRSIFGIQPKEKLRSLILQAENDTGDLAEMLQGVLLGMGLGNCNKEAGKSIGKDLEDNLIIIRDQCHTGRDFVNGAAKLITKYKPDLVWVDPLLSFLGDDVSSQKVCSEFLRNWMNPVSEATGIIWMLLHHTGKPSTDPKAKRGWTSADYSYSGTGSSELVNWARAVIILKQLKDGGFKLMLTKRGKRAGALEYKGLNKTTDIFLEHSEQGICWNQVEGQEEEESAKSNPGRPATAFNADKFLSTIAGEEMTSTDIVKKIEKFAEVKPRTAFNIWVEYLRDREHLITEDGKHAF